MKCQFYFLKYYFDDILVVCRCRYSQNLFNVYFYEQTFFEIFVVKGVTGQFF